jgi:MerR family transcriptional regulator, light-induced transcriptional regulator
MMKKANPDGPAATDPAVLPIREVSRRTGIPVAGLRNWEQRYGLPRPERSPSGQRLYRESDCTLLLEVQRGRASGLSLPAAMERATRAADNRGTSIFAGLRQQHPELQTHVMSKRILLALTRAIEDECCARAERPILAGSFQTQAFYRAARQRWADLARSAEYTLVFADFRTTRRRPGPVAEIQIPEQSPMRREWVLVCDAPDQPACVAGWEYPGQQHPRDADRVFEALWSVDPAVVRSAARIATQHAAPAIPDLPARLHARLSEQPDTSSADLRRASGLLERTLDYLSRQTRQPHAGP